MDVAVIGPGAVGRTVAAYLSATGHQVLLCGRTPRPQLELPPDGGDPIVVTGPVRTDPGSITAPVGLVLLAVKSTQNADAARWLARLCDDLADLAKRYAAECLTVARGGSSTGRRCRRGHRRHVPFGANRYGHVDAR